jgi:hypothetical protein
MCIRDRPCTFSAPPEIVSTLTARKGSLGASGLEHATKVVTKTALAHKRKTRRAASDKEEGMGFPENNND